MASQIISAVPVGDPFLVQAITMFVLEIVIVPSWYAELISGLYILKFPPVTLVQPKVPAVIIISIGFKVVPSYVASVMENPDELALLIEYMTFTRIIFGTTPNP